MPGSCEREEFAASDSCAFSNNRTINQVYSGKITLNRKSLCTIQMKGTNSYLKLKGMKWPMQVFVSKFYQATLSDWRSAEKISTDG